MKKTYLVTTLIYVVAVSNKPNHFSEWLYLQLGWRTTPATVNTVAECRKRMCNQSGSWLRIPFDAVSCLNCLPLSVGVLKITRGRQMKQENESVIVSYTRHTRTFCRPLPLLLLSSNVTFAQRNSSKQDTDHGHETPHFDLNKKDETTKTSFLRPRSSFPSPGIFPYNYKAWGMCSLKR